MSHVKNVGDIMAVKSGLSCRLLNESRRKVHRVTRKPERNKTRDQRPGPEPNSGTKFCQPNMGTKYACIKLKLMSNLDYRLFLEMHITIFFHCVYVPQIQ